MLRPKQPRFARHAGFALARVRPPRRMFRQRRALRRPADPAARVTMRAPATPREVDSTAVHGAGGKWRRRRRWQRGGLAARAEGRRLPRGGAAGNGGAGG